MPVRLYRLDQPDPSSLLPQGIDDLSSWSITEYPALADTGDVTPAPTPTAPSESAAGSATTRPRRARSAGKISSIVKLSPPSGKAEDEIYLGFALLRLEMADQELKTTIARPSDLAEGAETGATAQAPEAGVNAAGGATMAEQPTMWADLSGDWRVKAFRVNIE